MHSTTPKTKTLPNLGPLRAFLALTVVLLHIPLMTKNMGLPAFNAWPIFNKGYNAVWGFFTLSGFLIINLLFKEKQSTGTVEIKKFYMRRILRIYPVYYFVLIFGLAFYHYLLPLFHVKFDTSYSIVEGFVWCAALMPNVFFSLFDPGGILSVLWSIGIEEQFYLLVAPVSKFVKSKNFALLLALFTIVYFILYFNPYTEFFRKYRFMYFYFSMGGLLAVLNSQGRIHFLILPKLLRLLLYSAFVLYFFTNAFEFQSEPVKHLFSMSLFSLFILNISMEKEFVVTNKFVIHLGNISYGIYMYHMIALSFVLFIATKIHVEQVFGYTGSVLFINISTLIITIGIAHISFTYVEQAILKFKSNFRKLPAVEAPSTTIQSTILN